MPYREPLVDPIADPPWLAAEVYAVVRRLESARDRARSQVRALEGGVESARGGRARSWVSPDEAEIEDVTRELETARGNLHLAEQVLELARAYAPAMSLAEALDRARTLQPAVLEAAELVAVAQSEELAAALTGTPAETWTLARARRAVALVRARLELLRASFVALGPAGAPYARTIASALDQLAAAGIGPDVDWKHHVTAASHAFAKMLR